MKKTLTKARFLPRISVASKSNATQEIDETAYLIINYLNCIQREENSTYQTGL